MYGIKLETGTVSDIYSNLAVYNIGDTISLMLQVDSDDALSIGTTLQVSIKDIFGNELDHVTAELLGDVYVAEWKIPLSIHKLYNVLGATDISPTSLFYYLSDVWDISDGSPLDYNFLVERKPEEAVVNNCEYLVEIEDILSIDNESLSPTSLRFTSALKPFYTSVHDVKSVYLEEMQLIDDFSIANDIVAISKQVDLHMQPNKVIRQDQFDLAVRMYVKYTVARQHLSFLLNINAESKELDMLKYSRNSNDPAQIIDGLDSLIQKYSYIIWAGGKDTPFIPKTFTKGIFDPNRTEANRLGLDTSDPYPFVNTTTANQVVNINGNAVELRGTRTVRFLRGKYSNGNTYLRSEGPV